MSISVSNDSNTSIVSTVSVEETTPMFTDGPDAPYVTSSSSYYVWIAVVVIGVVGLLVNGFVLYAFCSTKYILANMTNILIINQTAADFYCSVMFVIDYSFRLSNIYLVGTEGYWICGLFLSDCMLWFGLSESMVNLACIAVERYIMIVHPTWHKNHFRPWMIFSTMVFTWTFCIVTTRFYSQPDMTSS